MYSASCPNCGAAMTASYGGSVLARCSKCPWMGQITFRWLSSNQSRQSSNQQNGQYRIQQHVVGGLGVLPNGATYPTLATVTPLGPLGPDEAPESDPLEARREALWTRFHHVAGMAYDLLRTVDTEDWQMPAWRRYERWQEAHAALYEALGGVRMDDYHHPARGPLDEALADVLLWALLTLDAVER